MTKHKTSYYEIILTILTLFLGVAFLQDSTSVKIFSALFVLIVYIVKELFIYLEKEEQKEFKDKIFSIQHNETQKEIESLRSEINKINLTLFQR